MEFPLSVIFFGRTGEGKSTLANMFVQGDIHPETKKKNQFKISDGVIGETSIIKLAHNEMFAVYDTIGLCETSKGNVSNQEALKEIKNYFAKVRSPLNFICYVKKKARFTKEDKTTFAEFKSIFKGGETNFVIIITGCNKEWITRNISDLREYFGNSSVIGVDFPFSDSSDVNIQNYEQTIRRENYLKLVDFFLNLRFKGVKLEVLEYAPKFETKVADVVTFVPVVGLAYDLLTSGVYLALKKPNLARRRLTKGVFGLAATVRALTGGDPELTQIVQKYI